MFPFANPGKVQFEGDHKVHVVKVTAGTASSSTPGSTSTSTPRSRPARRVPTGSRSGSRKKGPRGGPVHGHRARLASVAGPAGPRGRNEAKVKSMVSQAPPCRPDQSPRGGNQGGPLTWRRKLGMIVKVVELRLRFIVLMAGTGLVFGYWDTLVNHFEKWNRPAGRGTRSSRTARILLPDAPAAWWASSRPVPDLRHAAGAARRGADRDLARGGPVAGPARTRADRPGGHPDRRGGASPRRSSELTTVGFVGFDESRHVLVASEGSGPAPGRSAPRHLRGRARPGGPAARRAVRLRRRAIDPGLLEAYARWTRRPATMPDPEPTPLGDPGGTGPARDPGAQGPGSPPGSDRRDRHARRTPTDSCPCSRPSAVTSSRRTSTRASTSRRGRSCSRSPTWAASGSMPRFRGPTRARPRRPAGRGDGPGFPRRGVQGHGRADRARARPGDAYRRGAASTSTTPDHRLRPGMFANVTLNVAPVDQPGREAPRSRRHAR